jgi:hypothetical protein
MPDDVGAVERAVMQQRIQNMDVIAMHRAILGRKDRKRKNPGGKAGGHRCEKQSCPAKKHARLPCVSTGAWLSHRIFHLRASGYYERAAGMADDSRED